MGSIKGARFESGTVVVDGNRYEECTFLNCFIQFDGGELPSFIGCTFDSCQLGLGASASNAVMYLRAIYHGLGDWGKNSVETLFNEVRTPLPVGPNG